MSRDYDPAPDLGTVGGNIELAVEYAQAAKNIVEVRDGFPGRDSSGAHAVAALAALSSAHAAIAQAMAAPIDFNRRWSD